MHSKDIVYCMIKCEKTECIHNKNHLREIADEYGYEMVAPIMWCIIPECKKGEIK